MNAKTIKIVGTIDLILGLIWLIPALVALFGIALVLLGPPSAPSPIAGFIDPSTLLFIGVVAAAFFIVVPLTIVIGAILLLYKHVRRGLGTEIVGYGLLIIFTMVVVWLVHAFVPIMILLLIVPWLAAHLRWFNRYDPTYSPKKA